VQHCVSRGALPRSIEMNVPIDDGRRIWIHLSVIVYPAERGPLTAHIFHDVTESRHASDVLARVTALCEPDAPPADARLTFTQREREILRLVSLGLSNGAIAARLTVSAYTIRNHVQHILTKSGAHSRAEAVSLAFRTGLL
jgi:DNA-binding NarL/FixJ family response regulator